MDLTIRLCMLSLLSLLASLSMGCDLLTPWAPNSDPSKLECRTAADCPGSYICASFKCRAASEGEVCENGTSRPCYSGKEGCENKDNAFLCKGICKAGKQFCVDGKWAKSCREMIAPKPEECNEEDDNCDGSVDEGLSCGCKVGEKRACYSGKEGCVQEGTKYKCTQPCKAGSQTCELDKPGIKFGKWGACTGEQLPQKETCNDKDDNCDGKIDEDWPDKGKTCKNPGCEQEGKQACNANGSGLECNATPDPNKQDDCNGKDDDCDGKIDNVKGKSDKLTRPCYTGKAGTDGKGECKKGTEVCENGAWSKTCKDEVLPKAEECNGKDDDCDGKLDNDPAGSPLKRDCYGGPAGTEGKGSCKKGTQSCDSKAGTWGACQGEVRPTKEECNGKDDDCDGKVDNDAGTSNSLTRDCYGTGPGCQIQTNGTYKCVGLCKSGKNTCASGSWSSICSGVIGPRIETCDGKDNDCDGMIDDGDPGGGAACTVTGAGGKGECAAGKITCTAGKLSCKGNTPRSELCDGKDHDCDGRINNGCATTIAGSGLTYADGNPSQALFYEPSGITFDGSNLYVADCKNNIIRKIDKSGNTTLFAGTPGRWGTTDGAGDVALFRCPTGIVRNSSGEFFVSDMDSNTIRKISPSAGSCEGTTTKHPYCVKTIAGRPGVSGSLNGSGSSALFRSPTGLALDSNDVLYVADTNNHTIRRVITTGSCSAAACVSTYAGTPGRAGRQDSTAPFSTFAFPSGLVFNSAGSSLFVADTNNGSIREISGGRVNTISGTSGSGYAEGDASKSRYNRPIGLAYSYFRGQHILYIADQYNHRVRKLSYISSGSCETTTGYTGWCAQSFAGNGLPQSFDNTSGSRASFNRPYGLFFFSSTLYTTELGGHKVRLINTSSTATSTLTGNDPDYNNGAGSSARFYYPRGSTSDNKGNIYISDTENCVIRRLDSKNIAYALSGNRRCGLKDGLSSTAEYNGPRGLRFYNGNLYVADTKNHSIRQVALPSGTVRTIAGDGRAGQKNDKGIYAQFQEPTDLHIEGTFMLIADKDNAKIRSFSFSSSIVSDFAGTIIGNQDGPATSGTSNQLARFNAPTGITGDGKGTFFVADSMNNAVRQIARVTNTKCGPLPSFSGYCVTTLVGNGNGSRDGDYSVAQITRPESLTYYSGNLYVTESGSRIRKIDLANQKVSTLSGSSFAFQDGPLSQARFYGVSSVHFDLFRSGLVLTDAINRRIRLILLP